MDHIGILIALRVHSVRVSTAAIQTDARTMLEALVRHVSLVRSLPVRQTFNVRHLIRENSRVLHALSATARTSRLPHVASAPRRAATAAHSAVEADVASAVAVAAAVLADADKEVV